MEELSHYRSEFFGRLRQALGDRPDIRIVGDRFVLQSEVLFPSGSANLDSDGEAKLREVAQTLREVTAKIPPDIDWVLRVDGHTDKQPVRNSTFGSNWELSTARANSVVQFLIRRASRPTTWRRPGSPSSGRSTRDDDEIAYRRNRRIEFKLTEG